jgi:hypothetical protein
MAGCVRRGGGGMTRGDGGDSGGPGPKLRAAAAAALGPCIPDDALVEMFGLLPANSLHRFKCVSKAWCGLVTDPLHRQRFAQTLAGFLCRVDGDGGTESSWLTRPNATVPERKEIWEDLRLRMAAVGGTPADLLRGGGEEGPRIRVDCGGAVSTER